jgi:hypothetical protein
MRKTRFKKIRHRIYHTILKTAKSTFCTRKWFFARRQYNFRQLLIGSQLKLDRTRRVLQHTRVSQRCAELHKSFRTVRLGAPTNFRILHSKIRHETNKQWVRYGTMQSESGRDRYGLLPRNSSHGTTDVGLTAQCTIQIQI